MKYQSKKSGEVFELISKKANQVVLESVTTKEQSKIAESTFKKNYKKVEDESAENKPEPEAKETKKGKKAAEPKEKAPKKSELKEEVIAELAVYAGKNDIEYCANKTNKTFKAGSKNCAEIIGNAIYFRVEATPAELIAPENLVTVPENWKWTFEVKVELVKENVDLICKLLDEGKKFNLEHPKRKAK